MRLHQNRFSNPLVYRNPYPSPAGGLIGHADDAISSPQHLLVIPRRLAAAPCEAVQ